MSDVAKIQGIINAAGSGPAVVPPGTYAIDSTVNITTDFCGATQGGVTFVQQCPYPFQVSCQQAIKVSDFTVVNQGQTGSSIMVNFAKGNNNSVFERITLNFPYIGFDFRTASTYHVNNCTINQAVTYGISIQNTLVADSGDEDINGCVFASAQPNCVHIYQQSNDGLRIINCKMNGGNVGYQLSASAAAQGDLLITGCSIENGKTAGIFLSGKYVNVLITGCEFETQLYSILAENISFLSVTGNVILNQLNYGIVCFGCSGVIDGNTICASNPIVAPGMTIGTNFMQTT